MKKLNSKYTIFIGPLVVVLVILGIVIAHSRKGSQNSSYFKALSDRTTSRYVARAQALGVAMADKAMVKSCYYTEQTDFNRGNLWCGISVTFKISVDPDKVKLQKLFDSYDKIIKSQGYMASKYGTVGGQNGFIIDGRLEEKTGAICNTRLEYSPGTAYLDAKTTAKYSMDCSNRSTGLVDGFTDNSHSL